MRAFRTLLLSAGLAVALAGPAAAQSTTSTTMPPVRSIPVTPAPGAVTTTTAKAAVTTTTAKAAVTTTTAKATAPAAVAATTAAPMANTGLAADELVPSGFLLIGLGALLVSASRRYRRPTFPFV